MAVDRTSFAPNRFGLGISISPSWTSEEEADVVLAVAQIASQNGASVFMLGDKPGAGPEVRSNAVLLAWLLPHLVGVPRIGSLFLARQTPLDSLVVIARTLCDLIRHTPATPAIGVMRGRQAAGADIPGPDIETAAAVLRGEPNIRDAEIWVGAEQGGAIDRAARIADVWLANGYFGEVALLEQLRRFRLQASDSARTAVRRDFLCDPDSSKAHATLRQMLADGYRGGKFDERVLIAGSPAECLERMADTARLGFDDVLVRPAAEGPAAVEQFQMLFDEWRCAGDRSQPG
ncbi:MAG TPA: hypothetical protein VMS74_00415 [Acidimicrobiia bacterium]|nr:hypothetical protein [Acidimicrobiia bacterium]